MVLSKLMARSIDMVLSDFSARSHTLGLSGSVARSITMVLSDLLARSSIMVRSQSMARSGFGVRHWQDNGTANRSIAAIRRMISHLEQIFSRRWSDIRRPQIANDRHAALAGRSRYRASLDGCPSCPCAADFQWFSLAQWLALTPWSSLSFWLHMYVVEVRDWIRQRRF